MCWRSRNCSAYNNVHMYTLQAWRVVGCLCHVGSLWMISYSISSWIHLIGWGGGGVLALISMQLVERLCFLLLIYHAYTKIRLLYYTTGDHSWCMFLFIAVHTPRHGLNADSPWLYLCIISHKTFYKMYTFLEYSL